MRLVFICSFLVCTVGALPHPSPQSFSSNLLENFGNSSFILRGDSLVKLPNDGGFIATGSIKSPTGIQLSGVLDAPDIVHANSTSRFGLIVRLSTNGSVVWARRTCALPLQAKLHAAVSPAGVIFIAGARVVDEGLNSSLVLAIYNANGKQILFNDKHGGGNGMFYTGIVAPGNESVFLVAHEKKDNLSNTTSSDNGDSNSLTVAFEVDQGTGSVKGKVKVTPAKDKGVQSEKPEGLAISADGKTLYLLTRRITVIKQKYTKSDTVSAFNTSNLGGPLVGHINIDYGLGYGPKITVIDDYVYIAQITPAGSANKLRVMKLGGKDCNLTNSLACGVNIVSKSIPHPDAGHARILPKLAGISKAPPHVKVIFSSQSDTNDTHQDDHSPLSIKQNNLRPSVVDLNAVNNFTASVTADTDRATEASAFVSLGDDTLVFGTDLQNPVNTTLYLAMVAGISYGGNRTLQPRTGTNEKITGAGCIGIGSVVGGTSVTNAIRKISGIRLQRHPWQRMRIMLRMERNGGQLRVLCMSEGGSRVCATAGHVLFVNGASRYMRDICAERRCDEELQHIVSFKGKCGSKVYVHDGLAISMHSASATDMTMGRTARQVVMDECAMREKRWIRWFVTTM